MIGSTAGVQIWFAVRLRGAYRSVLSIVSVNKVGALRNRAKNACTFSPSDSPNQGVKHSVGESVEHAVHAAIT
jgi:hypothetical protein